MLRKGISVLLGLMLLLQLTACGTQGGSVTPASSTPASAASTAQSSGGDQDEASEPAETSADPLGKYDPPIEVHFVRQVDDTIETNVLANYPGETIEDNFWLKTYEDELGIKVVYDWIVKGDKYTQKLNVTLASGDIPDIMSVQATPMMQLVEAELIQPLDEVYEAYGTPLIRELLMQDGEAPFQAARVGGQLFGFPQTGGSVDGTDLMWIRTDWMEKVNMEAPKTVDEMLALIEAFRNADFDGNGKSDTVGMAIAGADMWGGYAGLKGFFNAFHAYPRIWIEKNGKLEYGSVQPEVKEALRVLNDMYNKGYIDREFGVMDGGKTGEAPGSGFNGFSFGQQWNSLWPLQSSKDNDPDSQWTPFPIPSVDGTPSKAQMTLGTNNWLVVNKEFANPEALIKMVNLFVEKCWGETGDNGKYYAPPEAEGVWKLSPVQSSPPNKNLDAFLEIDAARNGGDTSVLRGEARSIQDKLDSYYSGSEEGFALWGWERIYGPAPSSYSAIQIYVEENRTLLNKFNGAPTDTMTEKLSTLEKMHDEVFTKIILGESSIDDFDKFVNDFMTLGGQQITDEVNAWYESTK